MPPTQPYGWFPVFLLSERVRRSNRNGSSCMRARGNTRSRGRQAWWMRSGLTPCWRVLRPPTSVEAMVRIAQFGARAVVQCVPNTLTLNSTVRAVCNFSQFAAAVRLSRLRGRLSGWSHDPALLERRTRKSASAQQRLHPVTTPAYPRQPPDDFLRYVCSCARCRSTIGIIMTPSRDKLGLRAARPWVA